MKDVNVYILFQTSKFRAIMAEADYEQRMRELQRQYVDFLDDSDRDGVYDRSVVKLFLLFVFPMFVFSKTSIYFPIF